MTEKRKFPRYNCLLEVRYRSNDGKNEGYSFTKDLNKGGLSLPLERYISPRRNLMLDISLPNDNSRIETESIIVWCRKNKEHWQSLYSAGLQFKQIDPDARERLVNYANRHQWRKNDFEKALEENKVAIIK
jgi:c-di-GMP-binding flagellar brake protein YcgR